jgi:transcriptional regulator GlxA family with amidase domain
MRYEREPAVNHQRVAILCLPNTLPSTVFGPHDILNQAGVMWNLLCNDASAARFAVDLVSLDGATVKCLNGPTIPVAGALGDRRDWDLVLISASDVAGLRALHDPLAQILPRLHEQGAYLASVCTGAFALAETGLLDERRATTHWGMAPLFRKRYPRVKLLEERLVTQDGTLFCSGGFTAYQDLCLHLIEYFHGYELAEQTARALVLNGERSTQTPFRRFELLKQHGDAAVLKAQQLLEQEFARRLTVAELAAHSHLSERQFKRRFKDATGETPNDYLQMLRVEIARQSLRSSQTPVARVASASGYGDPDHFRDVFRRWTGVTPLEYRRKYQPVAD